MQKELSLLERLSRPQDVARYTVQFDEGRLLRSVVANVQRMLNVREGSVLALPDFGMPDFNDVVKQFPNAITQIQFVIKDFLERYEPRLKQVWVEHVPDTENPLLLCFAVHAQLRHDDASVPVKFDTVLTGSGQAMVRV